MNINVITINNVCLFLSSQGLIVDQTIEKVSFCAPDRNHEKGFAYICRDGTTRRWMCHGFLALKESVSVSDIFHYPQQELRCKLGLVYNGRDCCGPLFISFYIRFCLSTFHYYTHCIYKGLRVLLDPLEADWLSACVSQGKACFCFCGLILTHV